jgi:hypothetical protein
MMERRTFAVMATAAGLALGAVGDILFYGKQMGISFPIFVILCTIVLLALTSPARLNFRVRNLWPLIPLLFFAVMVAVRADWQIVTLDILATMALGALVLHYLPQAAAIDEDSLAQHTLAVIETGILVVPEGLTEAARSWGWLRERRQHGIGQIASAARGLVFAVPVVAVFGLLLGSADAVFASYVGQTMNGFLRLFGIQYVGDTVGQGMVTMGLATVATGALSYAIGRRAGAKSHQEVEAAVGEAGAPHKEKRKPGFKLSMIEGGIILGSVVLLFGAFVGIQFAYFFGGRATLSMTGLTFSDYARRGFFELLAVSILTLGLALWLDHVTIRQEKAETRIFRGLSLLLVGLTTVILVSAAQRMWLYEEAFGFTQLRVYTHVFIGWLGVLFAVFALNLFRLRRNLFSLGTLLVIIGYLVTMNLMNVDAYIAERNIARYHEGQGQELDVRFLNILSVDALPQIMALYTGSTNDAKVHEWAGQWLAARLYESDWEQIGAAGTVFSANLARQSAASHLEAMRDSLPAYNSSIYWNLFTDANDRSGDEW